MTELQTHTKTQMHAQTHRRTITINTRHGQREETLHTWSRRPVGPRTKNPDPLPGFQIADIESHVHTLSVECCGISHLCAQGAILDPVSPNRVLQTRNLSLNKTKMKVKRKEKKELSSFLLQRQSQLMSLVPPVGESFLALPPRVYWRGVNE